VLAFALLLRLSLRWTFDWRESYDLGDHLRYAQWFAEHWSMPAADYSRLTYGPPLFYMLCGALLRAGVPEGGLVWLPILLSVARLLLFFKVLREWLPHDPLARLVALGLAAVLPVSVHLDGMLNNESLSMLLALVFLWLLPRYFAAGGAAPTPAGNTRHSRWRYAALLGMALGLSLLTKLSGLLLVAALLVGALAELLRSVRRTGSTALARSLAPLGLSLALTAAVAGWHYVRHGVLYGKPLATAFDFGDRSVMTPEILRTPAWQRRSPGYLVRFPGTLFGEPFFPAGKDQLLPTLVASTFGDYYAHAFSPRAPPGVAARLINHRMVRLPVIALARAAFAAGVWIALVTAAAWLALTVRALRRWDPAALAVLSTPLFALAGQAQFATVYPIDEYGVVKGSYLQFAAPVLFALFGLAVSWGWRHRRDRAPLAMALVSLSALAVQAGFTLYCKALYLVTPG
jgi:hypothetical protein